MNLTAIQLHQISNFDEWKAHVMLSETLPDPFTVADCAALCLYVNFGQCDFFLADANNICHLGLFSKTDGDLGTESAIFDVYVLRGKSLLKRLH